jgi:hypothetical protein
MTFLLPCSQMATSKLEFRYGSFFRVFPGSSSCSIVSAVRNNPEVHRVVSGKRELFLVWPLKQLSLLLEATQ